MIDSPLAINFYNVAQLQLSLLDAPKSDSLPFSDHLSNCASPAIVPTHSDFYYSARRMSSSTISAAETDSSAASRPDNPPSSPSTSPQSHRPRTELPSWDFHSPQDTKPVETGLDSKVQLPSITALEDPFRRASLPTLSSDSHSRYRSAPYPPTNPRRASHASATHSNLASYHFPTHSDTSDFTDKHSARPRLTADTHLNYSYPDSSPYLATPTTSSSHFSSPNFASPLTPDIRSQGNPPSAYVESDAWTDSPSGIVRPSSTGQLASSFNKYEDGIKHSSFSATPPQMYSTTPRLPVQQDRRLYSTSRDDWNFSNPEYSYTSNTSLNSTNSPTPSAAPAPPTTSPTARSPQSAPSSTLVDRPIRKRGKLPKETTDYLKSWLHRHSDHPYPSEEEKKQLCHATGLSMSQVSNWMINARRRILAPAHRAAQGPTTSAPYPSSTRTVPPSLLDPIARRASLPAESLQLYHPMSLQSLPAGHGHQNSAPADYAATNRQLLARSSHHNGGGGGGGSLDYPQNRIGLSSYNVGHSHHSGSGGQSGYLASGVPMSAPPSLPSNTFGSHNMHGQTSLYSTQHHHSSLSPAFNPSPSQSSPRLPTHSADSQSHAYYNDGQLHSSVNTGPAFSAPQ